MSNPTAFQLNLNSAVWIDISTNYTLDTLPDRLPDSLAITLSSLRNLMNCPIGSRSRIFQPEYGSMWHYFLQQPIDDLTASQMQIAMIQAIARWEPRIQLDYGNTFITPDPALPGYRVKISGIEILTKQPISVQFTEQL